MANVNLKTDFKDGEKLFGQQLNNNFSVIKAALEAMNKIVWQDDPDDSVVAFRGTTEEINQRDIIDGQLLYDTTTGETYIDVGSQRISTGSGNAIHIGDDMPSNPSTQLWINPDEPMQLIGTEVVDSLEGSEVNKAPSVHAVKEYVSDVYSTDEVKTNKIWIDDKPIYRKVIQYTKTTNTEETLTLSDYGITNVDNIWLNQNSFIKTNNNEYKAVNNYESSSYITYCTFPSSTSFRLSSNSQYARGTWNLIIEYTKNEDEGGNN